MRGLNSECGEEGRRFEPIKPITEHFQDWRDARKGIASADTIDSEKEGIPRANVLAMYNRAKGLALSAAWLGKADNLRFGQGGMNFLDALLRDVGATHAAAARDASNGGYIPSAGIEAAWAALPKRAENSSLAQMQKFLAAHGIELAPDAVTRCNLDGVVDLEDHEFTTVNVHDEQPTPGIDVRNGTNQHSDPLVQNPIVKAGA